MIFKDPMVALFILFGLFTDARIKVSGLSLNYLNINIYNFKDS